MLRDATALSDKRSRIEIAIIFDSDRQSEFKPNDNQIFSSSLFRLSHTHTLFLLHLNYNQQRRNQIPNLVQLIDLRVMCVVFVTVNNTI